MKTFNNMTLGASPDIVSSSRTQEENLAGIYVYNAVWLYAQNSAEDNIEKMKTMRLVRIGGILNVTA
ncbi:MAG: hypothetical protein RE471_08755 [Ferroplasma sp.]|jgi:hypothetical protein|uniref:hypothetical protein n=1 Tax=Ferroplasma sp. TaxID=2591003 RepID=UPI0028168FBA|nr:hypothetical protein [Ferroplasma sp.]WMT51053.1 MAG: hypothetical protein RE471_08755 [Ferroplasma sp.]